MSSIVYIVAAIFIVVTIVRKTAKDSAASGKGKKNTAVKKQTGGFTNYRPHKDIVSVSRDMGDKKGGSVLRDDKESDWLARQLREEHRAFKMTSEMFDLKIEHASHCDARLIEQFHRRHCDAAGIDTGTGKTLRK